MLGAIATTAVVIAVAPVGLLALTGRMNWRYGATVIIGCFAVFGAASIIGGIQASVASWFEDGDLADELLHDVPLMAFIKQQVLTGDTFSVFATDRSRSCAHFKSIER